MSLFIAMLIGIAGTLLIERFSRKSSKGKVLVPVRKEDYLADRYYRR
jgi:hypothetical protein